LKPFVPFKGFTLVNHQGGKGGNEDEYVGLLKREREEDNNQYEKDSTR
jgi:hypothetical protein